MGSVNGKAVEISGIEKDKERKQELSRTSIVDTFVSRILNLSSSFPRAPRTVWRSSLGPAFPPPLLLRLPAPSSKLPSSWRPLSVTRTPSRLPPSAFPALALSCSERTPFPPSFLPVAPSLLPAPPVPSSSSSFPIKASSDSSASFRLPAPPSPPRSIDPVDTVSPAGRPWPLPCSSSVPLRADSRFSQVTMASFSWRLPTFPAIEFYETRNREIHTK